MEIDVKHSKQRNKRRERAQRMQAERDKDADGVGVIVDGDSADEDSKKPIQRPPQRRKKANIFKEPSPILEEDVVDGFAILSFKTYEDLEVRNRKNVVSLNVSIQSCNTTTYIHTNIYRNDVKNGKTFKCFVTPQRTDIPRTTECYGSRRCGGASFFL